MSDFQNTIIGEVKAKLLADAFVDSSNRSRRIIVIMVIASLIFAIAWWNSLSIGWIKSRINRAYVALSHEAWDILKLPHDHSKFTAITKPILIDTSWFYLDISDSAKMKLDPPSLVLTPCSTFAWTFSQDTVLLYHFKKEYSRQYIISANRNKLESLWHALFLCRYRHLVEKDDVIRHLEKLESVRTEKITIVPITAFGVVIDVNDLAFLGGLSLLLLLLWLKMSISRELVNLRVVMNFVRKIGDNSYYYWYMYLAMRQVMTVPRMPLDIKYASKFKIWRYVPKTLFFAPFFVQILVMVYDKISIIKGQTVNPPLSGFNFWSGLVLLISIFLLTLQSFKISLNADLEWDKAATDFKFPELRGVKDILNRLWKH